MGEEKTPFINEEEILRRVSRVGDPSSQERSGVQWVPSFEMDINIIFNMVQL